MTDRPDDTGLTPAQESEVRRLLADARHDEPAPDAVVARLDRVLADLATEPAREATVTRLADRRRRAVTMLVAAAAVVVVGIGISNVVGGGASNDAESSSAGAADEDAPAARPEAPDELGSENAAGGTDAEAYGLRREQPYRITARDFSADARALRSTAAELTDGVNEDDDPSSYADLPRAQARDVCESGAWGPGGYVSVLYDDAPGWVVIRAPQGDTQVADLFLCGSEVATRSVTLPVR